MQEEQGVPKEDWKKCRDDLSHILLQMASLDHFREMDEGSFWGGLCFLQKAKPSQPQKQEMEPKEESHTLIEAWAAEVAFKPFRALLLSPR